MMNAAERATRTAQAKRAINLAVLPELEHLMDEATAQGHNTITRIGVIHNDAVEVLQEAGYTVSLNHYSGTTITW